MKKTVFIVSVLIVSVGLIGCGKKQPSLEEMQEPLSMEALSALNATSQAAAEAKIGDIKSPMVAPGVVVTPAELQPLPPGGPYRPTAVEIQTALRNAGYYTTAIDAKIGPLTKKATEEFQKANGLQVDGKVGPKTWAVLSSYLNPVSKTPTAPRPAKKR